jgi:RNA polymerase sigma factor (sigma-70 family)
MEDREVVAAIVAGDPGGIAEAYDRYAMPLYGYCRSILPEPADAADAVQDTFLIATAKLGGLKDPGKLRPWLYAVARNECLRQLRSGRATSALDEAVEMPAESPDVSSVAEQAELRDLVSAALSGLNPAERDVIELSLRHELAGEDLAAALGVSRNHAHALLSRARSQLERSLGALMVARTGRPACPDLDAMLAGWDGQMTVLLRKRVGRHIERCEICGECKRRELSPALLAGAAPIVALSPGFREQVLRICANRTPAGLAHRASVVAHAGSFRPSGFPTPVSPPGAPAWHHVLRHSHAAMAGAATAVVAVGVSAVLIIGAHPGHPSAAGARGNAGPGSVTGTRGAPSGGSATTPAGGSGLGPSAAKPGGSTAPLAATAPAGPGGSSAAGTAPGSLPSGSSSASSSPAPSSPAPAQGTLAPSVSRLVLVAVNGHGTGSFTLTAQGGPVGSYSISGGSGLTVSPASGSLASGGSVTITVTSRSLIALDQTLTISPGGATVTVVLNVSV